MRLIPTTLTQKTVDPNDPTGGQTIDALMLRQKMLQQQAPETPAQIASPWQGLSYLVNTAANLRGQAQAERQETAGREQLAQAISGIDPTAGASQAQIDTMMRLDPELGMKFISDAMQQRRAEQLRTQEQAEQIATEGRANAEFDRRQEVEQTAKGVWVTDPNDPLKLTNPKTGDVKFIKPNEKWMDDPNNPGVQINAATNERKYPPNKIAIDKDGNIQIGGVGGEKPLTEQISKGLEFYTSAANAAANLDTGMDKALLQAGPKVAEAVVGAGPANYMATPEYRQAKTQGDTFINAVLRRESGAQITDPEYDRAYSLYLPRPGDDDRTLELKRHNRKVKLTAIKNGIGGAQAPTLELIETEAQAGAAANAAPPAATPETPAPAATPPEAEKFTVGKTYTDADGNRATYLGNGKWRDE